jgi:pyruvate/2-oxoglutarate/acetoin dehydrogenase E1 component
MRIARRAAGVALIAACCGTAAACSPAKTASHAVAGAPLEMADVHFYRHADDQTVYRVSKTRYCVVVNEEQMNAFGGFAQVQVVPASVDFKRGRTSAAPPGCSSP